MLMKPQVDEYEFKSAADLKAHYAAIHKRLYGAPEREKPEDRVLPKHQVWKGVSVESIIDLVARFYKISTTDLLESKGASYVKVRHTAMYLAYYCGKKTLRHIGNHMDLHLNTVSEGVRKIMERRKNDLFLDREIIALKAQIEEIGKYVVHSRT